MHRYLSIFVIAIVTPSPTAIYQIPSESSTYFDSSIAFELKPVLKLDVPDVTHKIYSTSSYNLRPKAPILNRCGFPIGPANVLSEAGLQRISTQLQEQE